MLVSPWPSRSSALQAPTLCGEPFNFTPLRPVRQLGGQQVRRQNPFRVTRWTTEKVDRSAAVPFIDRPLRGHAKAKTKRQCSAAGRSSHSASRQNLALQRRARRSNFGPNFLFKSRAGYVESLRTYLTSSTRSAGRYHVPESGIEVSTAANFLSREKRKMWLTFSYHVYL
jgi:hypothetical protein